MSAIFRESCDRTANPETPLEGWALGLTGEAGEVADVVKKAIYHGHGLTEDIVNKIIDECGDVLYYIDRVLNSVGSDINRAMAHNMVKLSKRYPAGFSTEASKH